jgi:hypothetical protein
MGARTTATSGVGASAALVLGRRAIVLLPPLLSRQVFVLNPQSERATGGLNANNRKWKTVEVFEAKIEGAYRDALLRTEGIRHAAVLKRRACRPSMTLNSTRSSYW